MANLIISGNRVLQGSKEYRKYQRDKEYLDLPNLSNGDEKIYLLAKIYENGGNHFRFIANGDFNINWGDGQSSVNYSSGSNADYSIDFTNISVSTQTNAGYRQAIITVIPQVGSQLSYFKIGQHSLNPNDANNDTANIQIIDVKMASPNITSLNSSFTDIYGLEQFTWVGTCNVTDMLNAFYLCRRLKKVSGLNTSNVTSFHQAFAQCDHLLENEKCDLTSATSVTRMYFNCYKIEYIEPYDLDTEAPSLTSIVSMFDGCSRLKICPITSCSNITNFQKVFYKNCWGGDFNLDCSSATIVKEMFRDCYNIISINATFPNNLTDTQYMFDGCQSLEEIKPFDCSNSTNTQFMFRNTYRLKDLSAFDFTSTTNMSYMFINCGLEKSPAQLGGGSLTYFSQGAVYIKKWGNFNGTVPTFLTRTFLANHSVEVLPDFIISTNITSVTNAFDQMTSLIKIPSWDVSNITNAGTWFQNCFQLVESGAYGMTVSHSYFNCNLERAQIVNVFNNLGTANGSQTITLTGNPGSDDLTASDLLIATNKGWTVAS